MDTNGRELISTGKAANILGISRYTLHHWVKDGKVTPVAVLLNGYLQFDREEIERLRRDMEAAWPLEMAGKAGGS